MKLQDQFVDECHMIEKEYKELREDFEMYNFGLLTEYEMDSALVCIEQMFESLKENYEEVNLNENGFLNWFFMFFKGYLLRIFV